MLKKIFTIIIVLFLVGCKINENTIKNNEKKELIEKLANYKIDSNYVLDYNFFSWLSKYYDSDVLKKLNIKICNNEYDNESWHRLTGKSLNVLYDLYQDNYTKMNNVNQLNTSTTNIKIDFVGDVSLADNFDIIPYYDSRNKKVYGILSDDVVEEMTTADIMVANNEFSISDRGTPINGKAFTFRANPNRIGIYNEMGVDLVTLANNHVYDYGKDAFLDTIDNLDKNNIAHVGAGKNIDEAIKPYYYIINGYKIAFVAATRAEKIILTPEATENEGGVFRCYDPTLLINTIIELKKTSDYVILLVHWGKEGYHELEPVIVETGKQYIDAGADLIVGSHAHMLQGMEYYKDKLIAYNMGNFIFDNERKETGILSLNINENGELNYEFIPCLQENAKTSMLYNEEKNKIITKLNDLSTNVYLDENGKIIKK